MESKRVLEALHTGKLLSSAERQRGLTGIAQRHIKSALQMYYLGFAIPVLGSLLRPAACFGDDRNDVRAAFGISNCFSSATHIAPVLITAALFVPHVILAGLGAVTLTVDGSADTPSGNTKAHGGSNWNFWVSFELLLVLFVSVLGDLEPELSWGPLLLVTISTTAWLVVFTYRMERVSGPVNASVMGLLAGCAWMCWAALTGQWVVTQQHAYANPYMLGLIGLPLVVLSGSYFATSWRVAVLGAPLNQLSSEDDLALWGYHKLQCAVMLMKTARTVRMQVSNEHNESQVTNMTAGLSEMNPLVPPPTGTEGVGHDAHKDNPKSPAAQGMAASPAHPPLGTSASSSAHKRRRRSSLLGSPAPDVGGGSPAATRADSGVDGRRGPRRASRAAGQHGQISSHEYHTHMAENSAFASVSLSSKETEQLVLQAAADLCAAEQAFSRLEQLHPRSTTASLHLALFYSSTAVRHSATAALRQLSRVSQMSNDMTVALVVAARQDLVLRALVTGELTASHDLEVAGGGSGGSSGEAAALLHAQRHLRAVSVLSARMSQLIGVATEVTDKQQKLLRSAQLQTLHVMYDVWEQLLSEEVDLGQLNGNAQAFTAARLQVEDNYRALLTVRPHDTRVIRSFAVFLRDIVSDHTAARQLMDAARRVERADAQRWKQFTNLKLHAAQVAKEQLQPSGSPSRRRQMEAARAASKHRLLAHSVPLSGFVPSYMLVRNAAGHIVPLASVLLGSNLNLALQRTLGGSVAVRHLSSLLPLASSVVEDSPLLQQVALLGESSDAISLELLDELATAGSRTTTHAFVVLSGADGDVGTVLRADDAACELLGRSRSDLEGTHVSGILPAPYSSLSQAQLEGWLEDVDVWLGRWFMGAVVGGGGHLVPVRAALFETLPEATSGGGSGSQLAMHPRLVLILQPLLLQASKGFAVIRQTLTAPQVDEDDEGDGAATLEVMHSDVLLSVRLNAGGGAGVLGGGGLGQVEHLGQWLPSLQPPREAAAQRQATDDVSYDVERDVTGGRLGGGGASVRSAGSGASSANASSNSEGRRCYLPLNNVAAWSGVPIMGVSSALDGRSTGEVCDVVAMPLTAEWGAEASSSSYADAGNDDEGEHEPLLGAAGDADGARASQGARFWLVLIAEDGASKPSGSGVAGGIARNAGIGSRRSSVQQVDNEEDLQKAVSDAAGTQSAAVSLGLGLEAPGGEDSLQVPSTEDETQRTGSRQAKSLHELLTRLGVRHMKSTHGVVKNLYATVVSTLVAVVIMFPMALVLILPAWQSNTRGMTDSMLQLQSLADARSVITQLDLGSSLGFAPLPPVQLSADFKVLARNIVDRYESFLERLQFRSGRMRPLGGWQLQRLLDEPAAVGLVTDASPEAQSVDWPQLNEYLASTLQFITQSADMDVFSVTQFPLGPTAVLWYNLDAQESAGQAHIPHAMNRTVAATIEDEINLVGVWSLIAVVVAVYVLVLRFCVLGIRMVTLTADIRRVKDDPLKALAQLPRQRLLEMRRRTARHVDSFIKAHQHLLELQDELYADHAVLLSAAQEVEEADLAEETGQTGDIHAPGALGLRGQLTHMDSGDFSSPAAGNHGKRFVDSSRFKAATLGVGMCPSITIIIANGIVILAMLLYAQSAVQSTQSISLGLATMNAQAEYGDAVTSYMLLGDFKAAAGSTTAQTAASQGGLNVTALLPTRAEAATRVAVAEDTLRSLVDRLMFGGKAIMPQYDAHQTVSAAFIGHETPPLVLDEAHVAFLLRDMCGDSGTSDALPALSDELEELIGNAQLPNLHSVYVSNCSSVSSGLLRHTGLLGGVHQLFTAGRELVSAIATNDSSTTFAQASGGVSGAALLQRMSAFQRLDLGILRPGMKQLLRLQSVHHAQENTARRTLVFFMIFNSVGSLVLFYFFALPYSRRVGKRALDSLNLLLLLPVSREDDAAASPQASPAIRGSIVRRDGGKDLVSKYRQHGSRVQQVIRKVAAVQNTTNGELVDGSLFFGEQSKSSGCCGSLCASCGEGGAAKRAHDARMAMLAQADGYDSQLSEDDSDAGE